MRQFIILLGAGASEPFDIPTMPQMVDEFEKQLKGEERSKWKEVKNILTTSGVKADLEAMLTVFANPMLVPHDLDPQIAYYLKLSNEELKIIDITLAKNIENKIKKYIYNTCNLKKDSQERKKQLNTISTIYNEFFKILNSKLGSSSLKILLSKGMLDIYTTNYDRCLENYFRRARSELKSDEIQLDEGISLAGYWSPLYYKSPDMNVNRLFKLHGSIQRYWTDVGIRDSESYHEEGDMIEGDEVVKQMMIWPFRAKPIYEYPFSNMFYEMREQLRAGSPLIVVGHSLRDKALFDILLSVADEVAEKGRIGQQAKFKMLLMNPDADKIKKEMLEPIEGFVTTVPDKFGTEKGFQNLNEILKNF